MKEALKLLSFLLYFLRSFLLSSTLGRKESLAKIHENFQASVTDGTRELDCHFSMVYYETGDCYDGTSPCMVYRRRSGVYCSNITQKTTIPNAKFTSDTGVKFMATLKVGKIGKGKFIWVICDHCNGNTNTCIDCCVGLDKNTLYEDGKVLTLPSGVNVTCCKGNWVDIVDVPPNTVKTNLMIEENGETFVQENTFNNVTGVLEMKVPQHGDLAQSTLYMDEKNNIILLQTNDTCQLSSIPDNLNLTEMASGLGEIGTVEGNNTERKYFILKVRESRVGVNGREDLPQQAQSQCSEQPIITTRDVRVSKEDYESGDLILVESEVNPNLRLCQLTHDICSLQGPHACGYGWTNPDPLSTVKGFTFHQVSTGVICVKCYREVPNTNGCSAQQHNDNNHCICTEIKNKIDLVGCRLQGSSPITVTFTSFLIVTGRVLNQNNEIYNQTITYNNQYSRQAITVDSPPHDDFSETKVIMNAASNGYWQGVGTKNSRLIKINNKCHVDTLPAGHFPVDMAIGMEEIAAGSAPITPEDEETIYSMLVNEGSMDSTSAVYGTLHELIQENCRNSTIFQSKETSIKKEESDHLQNGGVVFRDSSEYTGGPCSFRIAHKMMSTGCWRRPNTGNYLTFRNIVNSVASIFCYDDRHMNDLQCPEDFCLCSDIVDTSSFLDCFASPGQPALLFDATGTKESYDFSADMSILDKSGNLLSLSGQEYTHLPKTTNSVGAVLRGTTAMKPTVFICAGLVEESDAPSQCYMYNKGEGFSPVFSLEHNFENGPGVSAVFTTDEGDYWWIIGETGMGNETSVYFNLTKNYNLPFNNSPPTLPETLSDLCICNINNTVAFLSAPYAEDISNTNQTNQAWLYDFFYNLWTQLPNTTEKRSGASCGVLDTDEGLFIVLAGGIEGFTTEIMNLNVFDGWWDGPTLPQSEFGYYGSRMASFEDQLVLVGGLLVESNLQGLKPFTNWTSLGNISGIFNSVSMSVPRRLFRDLIPAPTSCGPLECDLYCISSQLCQPTGVICVHPPCCSGLHCVG